MFVDGLGNVKLKSKKCGPVKFTTCKSCQHIVKLLNRLKVKNRAAQQIHVEHTEPSGSKSTNIAPCFLLTGDRVENPVCRWKACGCGIKFTAVRVLVDHIFEQIRPQSDKPPIDRDYGCQWEGCSFQTKKKRSLEMHLTDKQTGMLFISTNLQNANSLNMHINKAGVISYQFTNHVTKRN